MFNGAAFNEMSMVGDNTANIIDKTNFIMLTEFVAKPYLSIEMSVSDSIPD